VASLPFVEREPSSPGAVDLKSDPRRRGKWAMLLGLSLGFLVVLITSWVVGSAGLDGRRWGVGDTPRTRPFYWLRMLR
jgi:hypothetical protein